MSTCEILHQWSNSIQTFDFPFDHTKLPRNGIYILFEKGEIAHGTNRIVRVGTHTGLNQLRSRLRQHFLKENKDRSIFRKNIGRALLHKENDPYLSAWELDLTTSEAKKRYLEKTDAARQLEIERQISNHIQSRFSFAVVEVNAKEQRLRLESRMISTVSRCAECKPSDQWLGVFSPKEKIRRSGLWLVNELNKEPLSSEDIRMLMHHQ